MPENICFIKGLRKKEARSLPRFVVFDECLAVAISAAERRSVEFISILQKFIHKCFEHFWLFNCGEFVIRDFFHRAAQGISVDFSRQARRLHSQCRIKKVPDTGITFVGIPEFQSFGTVVGQNIAGSLRARCLLISL
jgi:hypothetical protein